MNYLTWLEIMAHWAAILTAFVAVVAYGKYLIERSRKRRALETFLKAEKASAKDKGQRSLMHLAARLSMTEQDLMDSAFRSSKITTRVAADGQGFADRMLLEYTGRI